jgi:hypothetical protein
MLKKQFANEHLPSFPFTDDMLIMKEGSKAAAEIIPFLYQLKRAESSTCKCFIQKYV